MGSRGAVVFVLGAMPRYFFSKSFQAAAYSCHEAWSGKPKQIRHQRVDNIGQADELHRADADFARLFIIRHLPQF